MCKIWFAFNFRKVFEQNVSVTHISIGFCRPSSTIIVKTNFTDFDYRSIMLNADKRLGLLNNHN